MAASATRIILKGSDGMPTESVVEIPKLLPALDLVHIRLEVFAARMGADEADTLGTLLELLRKRESAWNCRDSVDLRRTQTIWQ
ncbi:hypothetical protein PHLGIDRAFT_17940 [Phlebiopsis gigantea 11061_1 CR5-6]|uniref:Uncharacterized protein n=1 Tax=Phlebiopsis gigantea (strain 11061_1 CR5-6) TaxID=745531 RepID=A0A0C3PUX6_PHLG1|nr:hypothetical protein PHLGIDRAFT_17940 [Phlebiopsis gigantea 11061_1 CR5-6]